MIYKRDKWFWADFSVNGVRYRVSLRDSKGRKIPSADEGTPIAEQYRVMAARAEEREIAKAERGESAPQKRSSGRLPFGKASEEYLSSRRMELAQSSLVKETELTVALKAFFGVRRLSTIKTKDVLAYRESRNRAGVGPAYINMEVGCLRRILKKAALWHLVGDDLKPLKEPESIGRALTFEERTRLLHMAAQKPEWETAYLAAVLAINTTARKCELRALEWRHVDFINRAIQIPKSKTDAGVRVVPLNTESYEALWRLRRRAEGFGQVEVSHFVFAALVPKFKFRKDGSNEIDWEFDATRAVGSWRTAWRTLTKKAGLHGLRFHDLRHTAISALGEAGVPDRVIMDIAGHVSARMLRRYSHIQLEAKRSAVQALSNRPKPAASEEANVTKHVTKQGEGVAVIPQVVENNGRLVGTRTPDLHRVKVAL
jgi:integrase